MDYKDWLQKYYPIPASEVQGTDLDRIDHCINKWEGLKDAEPYGFRFYQGGLVDEDNEIEIICAKNSCIACINQEWIGGDAYSTLFIDFREDTPVFVKAFDGLSFGRINGIATLSNGVSVALLYPGDDEIKIFNCEKFALEEYAEGETLKLAREAFSQIPKVW